MRVPNAVSDPGRMRHLLARLRTQFWLVPAIMGCGGLMLAFLVLGSGAALERPFAEVWWLYSGDAGTARDLLATLLSGLLTMTSLVVSMTFVVLSLAANQLGPRLITIITGDRQIQVALGFFLGTIIYVLIVLRSLDESLGREGVPHFAITAASGLTLLCLVALLLYMHKVSRSIISDVVVRRVAHELREAVANMQQPERRIGDLPMDAHPVKRVALDKAGYVQAIDYERLVRLAKSEDAVLRMLVRAGHFVLRCGTHIEIYASRPPDGGLADKLRLAVTIGPERSPAQDIEYSIRQLVEMALRALSSGIKDPFTVITVIDQLASAVEMLFRRGGGPPACFFDDNGKLRVLANSSDLPGLVDAAFDQIRQGGAGEPAVLIHLADTLGKLSDAAESEEMRTVLTDHIGKLAQTAETQIGVPADRSSVIRRAAAAGALIAATPAAGRLSRRSDAEPHGIK